MTTESTAAPEQVMEPSAETKTAVVRWFATVLGEAHRGILPHRGKLLAFGNRGQAEVGTFREWLTAKRYRVEWLAAENQTWVMAVTPPEKMRDTKAVLAALWDSAPGDDEEKALQHGIADMSIRLVFARDGVELYGPWFRRGALSVFWVSHLEELLRPRDEQAAAPVNAA